MCRHTTHDAQPPPPCPLAPRTITITNAPNPQPYRTPHRAPSAYVERRARGEMLKGTRGGREARGGLGTVAGFPGYWLRVWRVACGENIEVIEAFV
eukprot:scaffold150011_cov30-Tisochrysis_lutea.AAC.1